MINGLVTPTSGTVSVDGLDAARKGRQVRKKVGFVFTDPDHQIVMPTVSEDIAFSLRRSALSKAERADRVTRYSPTSASTGMPTTRRTCSPAARSSCWPWLL